MQCLKNPSITTNDNKCAIRNAAELTDQDTVQIQHKTIISKSYHATSVLKHSISDRPSRFPTAVDGGAEKALGGGVADGGAEKALEGDVPDGFVVRLGAEAKTECQHEGGGREGNGKVLATDSAKTTALDFVECRKTSHA